MKIKRISLFLLLILFMTSTSIAQKKLTLEDLNYGGENYYNMTPERRSYVWWGDNLIRRNGNTILKVNEKTLKETTLFTLEDVCKWMDDSKDAPKSLQGLQFPYAEEEIATIFTDSNLLFINWKKKEVKKISYDKEAQVLDCSSKSKAIVMLKDDNLLIKNGNGKESIITNDGSREIVYGQAVHRNEFGINEGTFFSPDGTLLAFYRMDQSMVADYPQVNIDARIAKHEPDKYPMAGETSHKVTIGIVNTLTFKTVYLDLGDVTDRYFTNIQWSPDGKTLYLIELNRDQTDQHLDAYDAESGKFIKTLYNEHNDKYTEPLHPITFLPWDDSRFILWSERDGFWHLYLMDVNGKEIRQLTKGEWVVMDLVGFNQKTKSVIITSRELSAIQQNIFAVNIENGKKTLLDNGKGIHYAILSDSGSKLVDVFSEPNVPRAWTLTNSKTGINKELGVSKNPWEGYDVPLVDCGTIKVADGMTDLYYRLVRPHDFNPDKKYPAIVYVYGGPHARNVDASWNYMMRGWEPYMANKGYVIFILDNRGSCDRGREFEQATFRQLGQIEMLDQMKGVEFLSSLPYVDKDKLGVHGWSFGGFMTTSLMTNYPDVFKVGVAGGPVIDWKWYEVMYGERYMDTPQQNPEGYEKTSLINKAADLKGKLLIITGYNDNTVVPQHCLSFLEACIDAGTQPDFFVYPGEQHNMRGHRSVHLHEKITNYFLDYLK